MKRSTIIANTIRLAAWAIVLALLVTSAGEACMICVPFPKVTHADLLLENESVILAREKAGEPYAFYSVEVLQGRLGPQDIEVFIPSNTLRRLRTSSEDAVVLMRRTAKSEWQYMTYADPEYQQFIRAILSNSGSWNGARVKSRRIAFFAGYLTRDHRSIREQAYLEVGRAPYASIKTIAGSVPREQIREFLTNWQLINWHGLYIPMLGQSRHAADRDLITKQVQNAARFGLTINLAAWVTAFIEAHTDEGIEEIEALYFKTRSRTRDELEEVLKGLSVLGSEALMTADPVIANRRRRIIESYAVLLDHYPMMAGWVARDLTSWQLRALVDRLSRIQQIDVTLDPSSNLAITYYLSAAERFPPAERSD